MTMRRIVSALLLLVASSSVAADFAAGMEAYERGDYAAALREFLRAAEQGNAKAQFILGRWYSRGEVVSEDASQAVLWFRRAAEPADARAQYELGLRYARGEGVSEDASQAVSWFRNAAEPADARAQYELGLRYARGEGVSEDASQAVIWFRRAAEQGNVNAQYELGYRYANGEGVPEDAHQARSWFLQAAKQGNEEAQFIVGRSYSRGEDVPEDAAEAMSWFLQAAKQGNAEAQLVLGVIYAGRWRGVPEDAAPEDAAEATSWFRRAAEQGNAIAQYNLGLRYARGEGVPEDTAEAMSWFHQAAEQGFAAAQYALGFRYDRGEGVPEDASQAVLWFRRAAEQGFAAAQHELGVMYANGRGVAKHDVRAYAWLNLAAAQGDGDAEQNRTRIQQGMTKDQIGDAQNLSRELVAARIEDGSGAISDYYTRPPVDPSRDTVRQVQTYLARLGYEPGPVDGVLGKRTTAAVRRFQQDHGIPPSGWISDDLLTRLKATAAAPRQEPLGRSGSGFLVNREDGMVVTNHHVVKNCAKVTVNRGEDTPHADAEIRETDPDDDLALIKINKAQFEIGEVATFSDSPHASLSETVTVAGYPLPDDISKVINVTTGTVSALKGLNKANLLQFTAEIQGGNSGGPLLDSAGNVIGVVVSKLDDINYMGRTGGEIPQNVNYAIKGALVRSFLDIHRVTYARLPSEEELTMKQVAERAEGFTVAVHCVY